MKYLAVIVLATMNFHLSLFSPALACSSKYSTLSSATSHTECPCFHPGLQINISTLQYNLIHSKTDLAGTGLKVFAGINLNLF
jgi:hypothetical protein